LKTIGVGIKHSLIFPMFLPNFQPPQCPSIGQVKPKNSIQNIVKSLTITEFRQLLISKISNTQQDTYNKNREHWGLMTLREMQNQAMQLSIGDRWRLVQSLLSSIQQETLLVNSPKPNMNLVPNLDPWT
jgi:hypothetical protein